MNKALLVIISVLMSFVALSAETYKIGDTEYYYDQKYVSTGKPLVKRSESNKRQFLNSIGYDETPDGYEVDHIIPLSQGGTDSPSNMQLLTIQQHKDKTAIERANTSASNYSQQYIYSDNTLNSTYSGKDKYGRVIYTGSRGGKYYINNKGNKVYIKKNQKSNFYNQSNYFKPSTNQSSSSKTIHTGPRGGKYYINSNGNKTYVKDKN